MLHPRCTATREALENYRALDLGKGVYDARPDLDPANHVYSHRTDQARYLVCWYRNDRANWEWGEEARDARITCPALMVTAGRDPVLTPSLSAGMERVIPQLQRGRIEACGHWTQQECPEELNRLLCDWLTELSA